MRWHVLAAALAATVQATKTVHKVSAAQAALKDAQPSALTIQIPIDHSTSSSNTYANRYWVNSTYYKSGGPIFFQDVGEETVTDDFVQSFLMEAFEPAAVMQLAAKYNGLGVMMEHRFYGESLPFSIDEETGLCDDGYDAYKYLTVDQALADVIYLAENFQPSGLDQYWSAMAPSQAPWIFLGGSYPGARAAWIRIRNPDVIYASWASSGPVETTIDMATYYEQVYTDMTANCSADMAAASRFLTNALDSGDVRDQTLVTVMSNLAQAPENITDYTGLSDSAIENASKGANVTDFGIAENLANFIGEGLQSYGFTDALLPFCTVVEAFNPTKISNSTIAGIISGTFNNLDNLRPTSKGIAATYGDQAAFLALMSGIYAEVVNSGSSSQSDYAQQTADGNSWTWQTCTEFGYFQVANTSSPDNLLSSFINVTSWQEEQCQATFPYAPSSPDVSALVSKYGGWNMNPSQVMFTDGLKDPWHTLSVQSTSVEIGAPNRTTTQTVPACGQAASGSEVFGLTYPDSYHVSDLLGVGDSATAGLELFSQAMDAWIPCFQKHTVTSNTTSSTPSTTSASPSASKTNAAGRIGFSYGFGVVTLALMLLL